MVIVQEGCVKLHDDSQLVVIQLVGAEIVDGIVCADGTAGADPFSRIGVDLCENGGRAVGCIVVGGKLTEQALGIQLVLELLGRSGRQRICAGDFSAEVEQGLMPLLAHEVVPEVVVVLRLIDGSKGVDGTHCKILLKCC